MPTFEKDGKKLLYVPIDIEVELPSEEDLLDFHNNNCYTSNDYEDYLDGRHNFCLIASRHNFEDWRSWPHEIYNDKAKYKQLLEGHNELFWAKGFRERFPQLTALINAAPFKQIAGVGFMLQMGPYRAHNDSKDPTDPLEPRRYNALLTNPAHNTFWLEADGEKIYPKVDPKYPMFAFNNTDVKHGTNDITGLKIVMAWMGVIDHEKHEALINRSVEKFRDKAIWL